MNGQIIVALALWLASAVGGLGAESALKNIRISKDGAGPSHLFWLSGPSQVFPDRDVVGIVDPLVAAVRLYTVRRSVRGGPAINDRLESIGVCALPIQFRPWRILQLKDEVQIEGMPKPGKNRHNANRPDFTTSLYSIKRDIVSSAALQSLKKSLAIIDDKSWDPVSAKACGEVMGADGTAGRGAAFNATRAKNRPNRTILLTNKASALSDTSTLTVRARTGGEFYLFSIRELEPAPSARVVQITEGAPTKDGMVRLNQRLLLFGKDGSKPFGEISFDDTHFRSKIGHKPLAVLPTGEVLAMGKQITGDNPEAVFRIQSCGFIGAMPAANKDPLCADEAKVAVSMRSDADADTSKTGDASAPGKNEKDLAASNTGENANSIFGRVSDLATFPWSVDTTELDSDCRTYSGCTVQGQKKPFVALKGIRLTRGTYSQAGLPYAQTETFEDFDRFFDTFGKQRFAKSPTAPNGFAEALKNVRTKQKGLPGNLKDDFTGDLGIDCSALVQLAWNGRPAGDKHRTSTSSIQNSEDIAYRCPSRLRDPSYLRSGDAIGVHVTNAAEHIVLYAANIPFDGASEFWLVLESSSACDGVCWSVYDPSFFNGWGLYRASNRSDKACPAASDDTSIVRAPFPTDLSDWREKVVKGLPIRR